MTETTLPCAIVWLLLPLSLSAQVAYSLTESSTATGAAPTVYLPSAGYSNGGTDPRGALPLPEYANLPVPANIGADVGGHCHDQATSTIYSCNGFFVQSEGHPLYDAPGLASSAGLGVYFPANHISGMAVDSDAGILYCTDGRFLRSFDVGTNPPTFLPQQAVVSPIQLSWLNSSVTLSGLGFESQTNHLWACATNGTIYCFDTNGAPLGPQPVALTISTGVLSGLAVNTTNGPGAINMPFCSFQHQGYHILVSDGINVYDALNPLAVPLPVGNPTGTSRGLAFSADGQLIPASSACPLNGGAVGNPNIGTGSFSGIRTSQPTVTGNVNNLELFGGPPNVPAILLFDYCPIQNGVMLPTGDLLYIWPLSPTVVMIPHAVNPFGISYYPLPLSVAPAGVQFSYQWYFTDVANPNIYGCFSDAMTVTCGMP